MIFHIFLIFLVSEWLNRLYLKEGDDHKFYCFTLPSNQTKRDGLKFGQSFWNTNSIYFRSAEGLKNLTFFCARNWQNNEVQKNKQKRGMAFFSCNLFEKKSWRIQVWNSWYWKCIQPAFLFISQLLRSGTNISLGLDQEVKTSNTSHFL